MKPKTSSDRSFGVVFSVVFTVIAIAPLIDGGVVRWWSLLIASIFCVVAFTHPVWLHSLNRIWTQFGELLHKLISPLIMGLIFFLTVTPIGLLMRLFNKDPLHLRFKPEAESYWIIRDQPGPTPESMKQQF
jgi:hypothetical protein